MISPLNEDDQLSCFVVVHGIDAGTFKRLSVRFGSRRGGIRPTDDSRYISIPVLPDMLGEALAWITAELAGRYSELYLTMAVGTKLSWSEVLIPAGIALLAGQHGAAIKVLFSHPQSG